MFLFADHDGHYVLKEKLIFFSPMRFVSGPQHRVQATERQGGERGAERHLRRPLAEPPSGSAPVDLSQGAPLAWNPRKLVHFEALKAAACRVMGCCCFFCVLRASHGTPFRCLESCVAEIEDTVGAITPSRRTTNSCRTCHD